MLDSLAKHASEVLALFRDFELFNKLEGQTAIRGLQKSGLNV